MGSSFGFKKFKGLCTYEETNCGRCKKEFLVKLLGFSFVYGLLSVNFIDLVLIGNTIPGYHLWLAFSYFSPFVPVLLISGLEDWELVAGLGFVASLMNDLFYHPVGIALLGNSVDLVKWYSFQFGFWGSTVWWNFNGGFFVIPVSSTLMAISIFVRIGVVIALLYKWWNFKRICKNQSKQGFMIKVKP